MKKICLTTIYVLIVLKCFSQNSSLIVAPKFGLKNQIFLNLPAPGATSPALSYPTNGYDGRGSKDIAAQNIYTNAKGEIIFFILGENIFDRYGNLITRMQMYNSSSTSSGEYVTGSNEVAIIPVEGNCYEYLIISSFNPVDISASELAHHYAYMRLFVKYETQGVSRQLTAESGPMLQPGQPAHLGNCYELVEVNQDMDNTTNESKVNIAVSPKMDISGKRFLFVTSPTNVWSYEIQGEQIVNPKIAASIQDIFSGSNFPLSDQTSTIKRNELELIRITGEEAPRLKFAWPIKLGGTLSIPKEAVASWMVDENADFIPSSAQIIPYPVGYTGNTYGVEMTKDGRYVVATHDEIQGAHMSLFDFDPGVASRTPLQDPGMTDFGQSQVEMDLAGNFLFATQDRLAKMTSPGPNYGWNDNFNTSINYELSDPFPNNGSNPMYQVYSLNDQIDQEDYFESFDDDENEECCKYYQTYEIDRIIITNSQEWNGTSNPYGTDEIWVRDEIVVAGGGSLSIKNMKVHFAEGARVVVNPGNLFAGSPGGRLTLDDATFTVDLRCEADLWLGVEVRGLKINGFQLNASKHGRFTMKNGAKVEHAHVGVLQGSRQQIAGSLQGDYTPHPLSATGGIFQSTESQVSNCKTAYFADAFPYPSASRLVKTNLVWDDNKRFTLIPNGKMVYLNGVRGIRIEGGRMANDITLNAQREKGFGLYSINSNFALIGNCTSNQAPCPGYIRGKVENFDKGVWAIESSLFKYFAYTVDRIDFTNCRFGIESDNCGLNRIANNTFHTRELTFQSAGIILDNNRSFTVSENYLTQKNNANIPFADGRVWGIVVRNSGENNHEIYKNTFEDLYIGGQSEYDNSIRVKVGGSWDDQSANNDIEGGLEWLCNTFKDQSIHLYDLTVVDGDIDLSQGNAINSVNEHEMRLAAANNRFSLVGEDPNLFHDIYLDQGSAYIKYSHLNDLVMTPYSASVLPLVQRVEVNNGATSADGNECPSKVNAPIDVLEDARTTIDSLRISNASLEALLVSGLDLDNLGTPIPIMIHQNEKEMEGLYRKLLRQLYVSEGQEETYMDVFESYALDFPAPSKSAHIFAMKSHTQAPQNEVDFWKNEFYQQTDAAAASLQVDWYSSMEDSMVNEQTYFADSNSLSQLQQASTWNGPSQRVSEDVLSLWATGMLQAVNDDYSVPLILEPFGTTSISRNATNSKNQSSVNVYPNPTQNEVWISPEKPIEGTFKVEVFDLTGRKLLTETMQGSESMHIELTEYKQRVLLLKCYENDNWLETRRLILVR